MVNEVEVPPRAEQDTDAKIGVEGELKSMGDIAKALDALSADTAALGRVLTWVNQRYGTTLPNRATGTGREQIRQNGNQKPAADATSENKLQYDSLADLFAAANPTTEADKALVVAYWFQVHQNQLDWTGYTVHSELKHLGHGVSNITVAIESLIGQKPQLALQTRKSGKSKQARKLHRLTAEGLKRVRQMVAPTVGGDQPV
jgi:hypothetical protein